MADNNSNSNTSSTDQEQRINPEVQEYFTSMQRKEKLLTNKLLNDKQCLMCKVVTGGLFFGYSTFHAARTRSLWQFYGNKERLFNVGAVFGIYFLSYLYARAAYQIYNGQNMQPVVNSRLPLWRRLKGEFTQEQYQQFLEQQIKLQEEKEEVNKVYQETQDLKKHNQ